MGLGNIWRFSAVVGRNGGGASLVSHLPAAFVFAVPLLILEVAVGRHLRLDVVAAFRSVRRGFAVLVAVTGLRLFGGVGRLVARRLSSGVQRGRWRREPSE